MEQLPHELAGLSSAPAAERLKEIRADIRDRLKEFDFIGLQEDYQHSCQRLV